MTQEPIYSYVKGQGWVVMDAQTRIIGRHRVSLEFRKPKRGEYYFDLMNSFKDYESVFDSLSSLWWQAEFEKEYPGLPRYLSERLASDSSYVVVTLGPK